MIPLKRVFSSHIDQVGYDPETFELQVVYKTGKSVIYSNVPANVGRDVTEAPSIGDAMHQFVRNRYPFRYVRIGQK